MTLLAAFKTVLNRYNGEENVVVGTPVANRNRLETEELIGFFVNDLVLRTDLSGNPSFRDLLRRVRESTLEAYEHQDVPFEKLVEELSPKRDLSHSPLFQVALTLQNRPQVEMKVGGVTFSEFGVNYGFAKFDLTLFLSEGEEGVSGVAEYARELYERTEVERLLCHLQMVLKGMATYVEERIGEVILLTENERQQVLYEWNDTEREQSEKECVHELFERQEKSRPDAIAVVYEDQQLSYRCLNEWANRLAHCLVEKGVGAEVRVALCLERGVEMVVGLLGVLKAGGGYVPLDPTYPSERLTYMLEDAEAQVLLTERRLRGKIPQTSIECLELDGNWEKIGNYRQTNLGGRVSGANLAYLIYTSGSTGSPKGVALTQESLRNLAFAQEEIFGSLKGVVILQFSSLCFDASIWEMVMALLGGAKLLLSGSDEERGGERLRELLEREQVEVATIPPSVLASMARMEEGKLGTLVVAGEACPESLVREWAKGRRMLDAYGPTETTVCATISGALSWDERAVIGRPIANTQVYVVGRSGWMAGAGVPGELCIGGKAVGRGYWNQARLTAERFVPDGMNEEIGARLYRSGDRAKWLANGELEYLGRRDEQVKVRGYRIELGEIESALGRYPEVEQVVVAMREDKPGERRLVAYLVARVRIESGQMREYLKGKLPDYMHPSSYVQLEQMPLTPNGKVDRRALPKPEMEAKEGNYLAPGNEVEEILCGIWAKLLGVDRVGVNDNYFELGGDSILSIQAIARIRETGLHLTPRQFFEYQTIAELAKVAEVGKAWRAEQGVLSGPISLTPIQQAFFEWDMREPHHFNQAVMLELKGEVESRLLEQAMMEMLRQHDVLRLRFERRGREWQQSYVGRTERIPYRRCDLRELPVEERRGALEADAARAQASLNLAEGKLVQAIEYELGERGRRLLLVIHHLAIDGVSWRILLDDIERVYQQLQGGDAVKLPAKTSSYREWAERLEQYSREEGLKGEIEYWLAQEWGEVEEGIPVDNDADGENTIESGRSVSVWLSEEETQSLLQEVPAVYHTQINDVLLTGLVEAYSRWSGKRWLVVELEGHGREDIYEEVDLTRTVGWFTTIFPVLLHLEGEGAGEAIKKIKEQLRAIPQRGLGYGVLRYLSGEQEWVRRMKSLPRPEVSFNYLGQFDQMFRESSLFRAGEERCGPMQSPRNQRQYLLEVSGMVVNGRMRLDCRYSENIHQRATIERLGEYYAESLRGLISNCRSPEAGGYTPSDFPDVRLTQEQLDKIITQFEEEVR